MTTITDTFNRADGALTGQLTDTGETWLAATYGNPSGLAILANQVTATGGLSGFNVVQTNMQDGTVQATYQGGNWFSLLARESATGVYRIEWGGGTIYLERNGSVLSSANEAMTVGKVVSLKAETLEGSTKLTVKVNGAVSFTYTDSSGSQLAGTKWGLGFTGTPAATLDNFSFTPAPATDLVGKIGELASRTRAEFNAVRTQITGLTLTGVGDGYVLTYDAATSQWVPRPGGGAVGSWENDQLVTFTNTITEAAGGFTVAGNAYPGSPQHSLTVTSGMLATADKTVGFTQVLEVVFLFSAESMTGATSCTLYAEATVGATVSTVTIGAGTSGNNQRPSVTFLLRDVVAGEVITFRFRTDNADAAGVACSWVGSGCYPQNVFNASPPGGGRYLYRDFVTGTHMPAPLAISKSAGIGYDVNRIYDNDVATDIVNSGPEFSARPWISGPNFGIFMNNYVSTSLSNRLTAQAAGTSTANNWTILHLRAPQTFRYDRLAIPVLP